MIKFKELELKNFISVGDNPITLKLDRSPTTLITGNNGVGKSAIIADGLTFALFGKSFRGVNKAALVNTVNQRDSYTKLTFSANGAEYVIIRGQKPARLEIYKNDKLLNEDAAVSDTQNSIETDILGFDLSTFIRVCILSTMNYVPFMQLSAYERRNFVENMLSLKTFTDMNKLHRTNMSTLKEKITETDKSISILKTAYTEKNKTLGLLEQIDENRNAFVKDEVDRLITAYAEQCEKISTMSEKIGGMKAMGIDDKLISLRDEISKVQRSIREYEADNKVAQKQLGNLSQNATCNSCLQSIDENHVNKATSELNGKIANRNKTINSTYNVNLSELNRELAIFEDYKTVLAKLESDLEYANTSKKILGDDIKKKVSDLERRKDDESSNHIRNELAVLKSKLKQDAARFDSLKLKLETGVVVTDLLKDGGIKGTIIKQYIPLLVGYVNHYLEKLNISIKFSMDENFTETITTRYANEYTYSNLSAGERGRIDMAIAFAWRQIARIKGSVYCNILVLDEVADASLDVNGTEDLMAILEEITTDTNVFIISHKAHLDEHVRSVLRLAKQNGFTQILE